MKKVLILEDNPVMLKHLADLIGEINIKTEIYPFNNTKDAYQCAVDRTINLFVVDIILDTTQPGDSSGLKFVDHIRRVKNYDFTPVIFVSSLSDVKAYTYEKLHCYNFIEKPFQPEKLQKAVEECLRFPDGEREEKTLYFRKDGIILALDKDELVYAESSNHVLDIHTSRGDLLKIPYITLKKLQEELDSPEIIQCSRRTIVNKRFIHNVDIPNRVIQLKDDLGRIEIGITYIKTVREIINLVKK